MSARRDATVCARQHDGAGFDLILDVRYQPIVEVDGTISGIFVLGNDITGHRELEQHNERLGQMVSQSSKCMAITDASGAIIYVNDAGRRLLGLTDLQGITARCFFADDEKHINDDVIIPALISTEHWQDDSVTCRPAHDLRRRGASGAALPHRRAPDARRSSRRTSGMALRRSGRSMEHVVGRAGSRSSAAAIDSWSVSTSIRIDRDHDHV